MQARDLPGVMAVERLTAAFPWTEGIMRDCLQVGYSGWVYDLNGEILGYAFLSAGGGEAHVLNIAIHPGHQGRGLGRALMQHLLERARGLHAETVFLEVRPSNKTALRLYDSLGFNQAGLRRNYYPSTDGREDALIMALAL